MASDGGALRTERTNLRHKPDRGAYDRQTINAILDEGFVCHLGFVSDNHPYALPTIYGRDGERLLVHGSMAGRMLRALAAGARVCVTVTLVDGLVLARSARMHSINYRSVVVLGMAKAITDSDEKTLALSRILEHIIPGRWAEVRPPNAKELRETSVLEIPIREASAKIRTGPALHSAYDTDLRVWSGEVSLTTVATEVLADPHGIQDLRLPKYLQDYLAKRSQRG